MDSRTRTKLVHVGLVPTVGTLERDELRSLAIQMQPVCIELVRASNGLTIDAARWDDGDRFVEVDRDIERMAGTGIAVRGPASKLTRIASEILVRCQRFVDRRNDASSTDLWRAARKAHEELHDCAKPLVKADLEHAIDTWQWLLRLAPKASLELQLAALFHDVERLESEADARVEHHAPDYAAFKDRHALRGGDRAYDVLRRAGAAAPTAKRVRELVSMHERRGDDAERDLLNDADALSFFSLNSPGYADYFGREQTRKKVEYTLRRLGAGSRARLGSVRLRSDIREHVVAVLSREGAALVTR